MSDERKNKLAKAIRRVKMPPEVLEVSGDVGELASTIAVIVAGCVLDKKTMSGPETAIISFHQGWSKEEKDLFIECLKLNDVWRGSL